MFKKFVWAGALSVVTLLSASANVSLRNGNFFIGYTDVVYPGGYEPKIERVYNSKTPYNGVFGWGWGNEYEVFLTVSADGSVVVSEYGGGAQNRFSPANFNASELDQAVTKIVEVARASGAIGSADQLANYKAKLKSDAVYRNDEWQKYRAQGKLQPRQLAAGTKLSSNRFAYQTIQVTSTGYVRTFDSGKVESFDQSGRLVKVQDKNGGFIQFTYNKSGQLEKLVDNQNRKMFFTFNNRSKVVKIQGENNKIAEYKYNNQDELVWSKDTEGNVYTYGYSSDKRHNLVQIGYADKTKLKVAYFGRDKFENVKSVTDRDGTITEYSYDKVGGNKNSLKVGVNVKSSEGRTISASSYEYTFKYKASGEEWTYRMLSNLDGTKTDTLYNECCGLPIMIKRGNEETAFAYDTLGRVTKKTTPNEVTELQYDKKVGKVSKVVKHQKGSKRAPQWSTFTYDNRGNLTLAKNSDKMGVSLFYDSAGRIRSMLDQNKRRIDFKYNENSKPVEIVDPALGSITVSYTNSGEVKKVDSKGGRKIALQVTSAFQNLLEIIRPAGVTLSF
jgi:YD repeat-containing protein